MSDKNFEQSVRSKMDELSFHPSEDVWTKVEAELDHGKKRRRLWLWIPVAAAMLGLLWIGINNSERITQHSENSNQRTERQEPQAGSMHENGAAKENETAGNTKEITNEKEIVGSTKEIQSGKDDIIQDKQEPGKNPISLRKPVAPKESLTVNHRRQEKDWTNRDAHTLTGENRKDKHNYLVRSQEGTITGPIDAAITGVGIDRRDRIIALQQYVSLPFRNSVWASGNPQPATLNDIPKKKDGTRKKWNLYVTGSAGIGGVNDGGLLDIRTAVSDFSAPTPVANYGGGRGLTSNYAVILRPVSPGFYMNLQAGLERSIARKWSVGAALGYSRFSTSMKEVGWDKRTINMHYGLLDLPVMVSFNQQAFDLNIGMISSAIISYQVKQPAMNSIQVADADDLNRLQVGLTAGADIKVFRKSNHLIKVGPTFRYQFTNLQNNKISAQHLASGAIHLKWYLNKQ